MRREREERREREREKKKKKKKKIKKKKKKKKKKEEQEQETKEDLCGALSSSNKPERKYIQRDKTPEGQVVSRCGAQNAPSGSSLQVGKGNQNAHKAAQWGVRNQHVRSLSPPGIISSIERSSSESLPSVK